VRDPEVKVRPPRFPPMADRELIEWVANAKVGDEPPAGYRGGMLGAMRLYGQLVEVGAIRKQPFAGSSIRPLVGHVPELLGSICRDWLRRHPA
jgi:hypothetical protein